MAEKMLRNSIVNADNAKFCIVLMLCLTPVIAVADVLIVDSFGAVANDGKPDDSAISAVMRKARTGDTIQFAAGTYHLRDAIHMKSGITLAGDVTGKTILRALPKTMLSQRQSIVNMDKAADVVVKRLTLDGDNQPDLPFGVLGGKGRGGNRLLGVHIANIAAQDAYGSGPVGVLLFDQPGSSIRDSEFQYIRGSEGQGAAIGLYGGPYVVDGNHISNVGRNGLYALRCSGTISNNVIVDVGTGREPSDTGLSIELHPGDGEGGCSDVVVENNQVDSWISVVGASRAAIRHNRIGHKKQVQRYAGLEVSGENLVVTNNLIGSGVDTGIVVERPSFNIAIVDNQVNGVDNLGMSIIGARQDDPSSWLVENVLLSGNSINGVSAREPNSITSTEPGTGLEINNNAVRVSVIDNEFENNDACAIALFDERGDKGPDRLFFINNHIKGNREGVAAVFGFSRMSGKRIAWVGNRASVDHRSAISNPFTESETYASATYEPKILLDADVVRVGEKVQFSIEVRNDVQVTAVIWDFGEGPPVPGTMVPRRFANPGVYRIQAIIWRANGLAQRVRRSLVVTDGNDVNSS